jgi:MoaA/NifB/PqqE/SkfB family radical SAM enzyme
MPKFDFIWNITLVCPWDCEFCCTDAAHVSSTAGSIRLRENNLSTSKTVSRDLSSLFKAKYPGVHCSKYDIALIDRQLRGLEPTFEEKMEILSNLEGLNLKIDFAGGEPLACHENILVIKAASEMFGKNSISVTSTGIISKAHSILEISGFIGEYEFTYDEPKVALVQCRPKGYNNSNLRIAAKFSELGVRTKAQLPIHRGNTNKLAAESIYNSLCSSKITELLLMRTFPVGRGMPYLEDNEITKSELTQAIVNYSRLETPNKTNIRLQCALKSLAETEHPLTNPCDLMQSSYGINFQGDLLISAWANNINGLPLSDDFVLGSLCKSSFKEISKTEKFQRYKKRLNENFGHCKIFSYANSKNKNEDSLFGKSDPLFLKKYADENQYISLFEVQN